MAQSKTNRLLRIDDCDEHLCNPAYWHAKAVDAAKAAINERGSAFHAVYLHEAQAFAALAESAEVARIHNVHTEQLRNPVKPYPVPDDQPPPSLAPGF